MTPENDQHVYHHYTNDVLKISAKVEKNTKGFNYEASVTGATTVDQAMTTLKAMQVALEAEYGTKPKPDTGGLDVPF